MAVRWGGWRLVGGDGGRAGWARVDGGGVG